MSSQPYIGLRSFSREEQALFFGREQHTNELLERLKNQHFLAIVGDSGCGKSSLIKAGLIPSLQTGFLSEAGSHWRIAETRPGNEPFANLAKALAEESALGKDYQTALSKNEFLTRSPFSLHELLAIKPLENNAKLLIVCDQFEELFRYSNEQTNREQAAAFVALLLASANPYPLVDGTLSNSIYIILTMRSDYLGDCARFAGLSEAINQGLYLTPRLNRQQLRDAIERPALVCNGKVEPALLVKLLSETGNDADQLPLLQHLLMRLWDGAKHDDQPVSISLADYQHEKIQSLKNALSIHADEAYDDLDDAQKAIAKQIFCRLTGQDSNKADTRNPTAVSALMELTGLGLEQVAAVLQVFRQAGRCFLMPPEEVRLTPETVVDIAHESLIRNWERLEDWAQEETESAEIYCRLEQNALLHEKGDYGFYRSPELENALAWQQENKPTQNWAKRYGQYFDLAMAFLDDSVQEQQAKQERKQRAEQREIEIDRLKWRLTLGGFLLTFALMAWAVFERHRAEQTEQQRAVELFQSRLTHASLLAKSEDYAQARKVLDETDAFDEQVSPSLRHARNLLHSFTLIKGGDPDPEQIYKGANNALLTVAISPDGQLLAAGGEHGTVVIFDVHSHKLLQHLHGHATECAEKYCPVRHIAFTPSGQQLISASADKTIIIWQRQDKTALEIRSQSEVKTGESPTSPCVQSTDQTSTSESVGIFQKRETLCAPDIVNAISISPDGKLLASGGNDKAITLWDLTKDKVVVSDTLKTPDLKKPISGRGLAFSPDGRYLASGSHDNTAIIWQIETKKPWQFLKGHTDGVKNLSFSTDSATLATTSEDKTLRLWDVATGKQQRVLSGHQNKVLAVSWLGDYLLTGSDDSSLRLWDSRSGVSLRVLQGHEAGVTAFAIYSGSMWSASNDGTVRRWSLKLPFQQALPLPTEPLSTVITPSLTHVAVGFVNGALALYDLQNTDPIWQNLAAHSDKITRLAVNHDGNSLASGSFDGIVKLWQIKPTVAGTILQECQTLTEHKKSISALDFSPDDRTLATASDDGQIGLFAVNSSKLAINIAHTGKVASVEFDNTGTQLVSSGYDDKSVKRWNIRATSLTGKDDPLPITENNPIRWATISPDGRKLVSAGRGGNKINVYDRQSSQPLFHLTGHENVVFQAAFAPDSQQLATISADTTVKFWELDLDMELFSLALPTNQEESVASIRDFSFRCQKDNCLIAAPIVSGQLQLYQLAYEGKLTEDAVEQKRQQLEILRIYLATIDTLLQTKALQPALQAMHETEQLAKNFSQQFPDDPALNALKAHSNCQRQLLTVSSTSLSAECQSILNSLNSAEQLNRLGYRFYKQKQYSEAQAIFAKGLEKFSGNLSLLSSDAELALVQGENQRMQRHLNTLKALYHKKTGQFSDFYPVIMSFLQYLSDSEQTPETVLKVIAKTDTAVRYDNRDFSDLQPVLNRQNPKRQKIAALFIDFFQNRIDLDTLKAKLNSSG
jgi:WD40 repeat protein